MFLALSVLFPERNPNRVNLIKSIKHSSSDLDIDLEVVEYNESYFSVKNLLFNFI